MTIREERRRFSRLDSLSQEVILRGPDGSDHTGTLVDLSAGGLAVQLATQPVRRGEHVVVRVAPDGPPLFGNLHVRDVERRGGVFVLRCADGWVACQQDSFSDYEVASKEIRDTARMIVHLSTNRKTTVDDIVAELTKGMLETCAQFRLHLRTRYGVDSGVFIQSLVGVEPQGDKKAYAEPPGCTVVASATAVGAMPASHEVRWNDAPHLRNLFFLQGAPGEEGHGQTDWLPVLPDEPDRRLGVTYLGGLSLALRQGKLDPEPTNGRMAPEISGFVSVLTAEPLETTLQLEVLHAARCLSHQVTVLWCTYDLARRRVAARRPISRALKYAVRNWNYN